MVDRKRRKPVHILDRKQLHSQFIFRIMLPLLCAVLAAGIAAGAASYYLANRSDEVAIHRQERETEVAVQRSILKLTTEQETVAIWDDTFLRSQHGHADAAWLNQNIGIWLHSLFQHDSVYILDNDDHTIYAMRDGTQEPVSSYAAVAPDLNKFVEAVRGRGDWVPNRYERLPGHPLAHDSQVLTSGKAIHATDLSLVQGRPAIVSAMRIMPYSRIAYAKGSEPILISVRFLDRAWLRELASQNLIDSPRFSMANMPHRGEATFILQSDEGRIGYLMWHPENPGTALNDDLQWIGVALVLVFAYILYLLLRAFYRMTERTFRAELTLKNTVLELRASEMQAQHLAFHDVLTGLPNRALFQEHVQRALGGVGDKARLALFLIDIDRFKQVNDTLGHQAGDALIRDFGSRLAEACGAGNTVARLSGDEFAVLVRDGSSVDRIAGLCEAILTSIRRPFEVVGTHAYVGASIGIVLSPDAGVDRMELMRKADIALYQAKGDGRDCYRFFDPQMDETLRTRCAVEDDLRIALNADDQLQLFYQPQMASNGGPIIGLEALIRWKHPTRGLISPETFIPIAEETGQIVPLGEWVLREACRTWHRWPDLFVAVNLSPIQFRTAGFAERVIDIVREEGADPRFIELEITETVLVQNDNQIIAALARFRKAGFRIALDDFGTGYSSLSYLRRFEVDKIKIDRSFVQNLGTVDAAAIITAVVTLGHAMGLQVTAEGVETSDQSTFLSAAGCNILQGFFFSRALPQDDVALLLAAGQRRAVAA